MKDRIDIHVIFDQISDKKYIFYIKDMSRPNSVRQRPTQIGSTSVGSTQVGPTPVGPDGKFMLDRYLGRWYQVGQLPTDFQQSCARSIANYELLPPDRCNNETVISVFNECLNSAGGINSTITGTGVVYSDGREPELIVSFPQFPSTDVNYVVRETDYVSYAIVGTYDKQSLFLLARDEQIDQELLDYMLRRSAELGYPVNDVVIDRGAVRDPNDEWHRKRRYRKDKCDDDSGWSCWWWIIAIIVIIIIIVVVAGAAMYNRNGSSAQTMVTTVG